MHKSNIIETREQFRQFLKNQVGDILADDMVILNMPDHYPFVCLMDLHSLDISFVYPEDFENFL